MTDEGVLQRVAAALVSRPWIYELVQRLAGRARVVARLRALLAGVPGGRALDVGSAGGDLASALGLDAVCLDVDAESVRAMRRRDPDAAALVADAARLPFADASFDVALCVDISHHLPDATWTAAVRELRRVTRGTLVFMDAVRDDGRAVSRLLWRYDRGRFPRRRAELLDALGREFRLREVVDFSVYHRYLLCSATPDSSPASRASVTESSAG